MRDNHAVLELVYKQVGMAEDAAVADRRDRRVVTVGHCTADVFLRWHRTFGMGRGMDA